MVSGNVLSEIHVSIMFLCSDVLFQLVTAPEEINDDEDMMDTWRYKDGFLHLHINISSCFSSVKCEEL